MKSLILVTFFSLLLSGCTLPFSAQKNAGLSVTSDPISNVYIDDQHVGNTPFVNEKIKPGEHVIKIISQVDPTQTYETKVNLKSEIITLINRTFAASPQESSSYILDLEKINNRDKSEITIISTPPNAIVRLDDQPKGFAPLPNLEVNPGQHKVTLNAQGYQSTEITSEIKPGYRLILTAELGKLYPLKPTQQQESLVATESALPTTSPAPLASPSPVPSSTPSPAPTPTTSPRSTQAPTKPYVEILPTSTGWLRVRSEPNGLVENEVAKVNPGETYSFIESNGTGWYKIEYAPGKQGWIAAQYAKLFE